MSTPTFFVPGVALSGDGVSLGAGVGVPPPRARDWRAQPGLRRPTWHRLADLAPQAATALGRQMGPRGEDEAYVYAMDIPDALPEQGVTTVERRTSASRYDEVRFGSVKAKPNSSATRRSRLSRVQSFAPAVKRTAASRWTSTYPMPCPNKA